MKIITSVEYIIYPRIINLSFIIICFAIFLKGIEFVLLELELDWFPSNDVLRADIATEQIVFGPICIFSMRSAIKTSNDIAKK